MHAALGGLQQRAQRRLLAEAALAEDSDASSVGTKREVPEGSEADGLGALKAPCSSRDRARASLRRLHPTALCYAKPAAPAAATEPGGLEPLSRPLPAAAPGGGGGGLAVCWYRKALPWAHLAAREQAAAAAAVEVITSGRNGDGYEEVETALGKKKKTKKQPAAAQDWSWLASPPWGVVPLPPEQSSRVDWRGRLQPGAGGAPNVSASAAAATAAAHSPPPPQPHPDPHCAQLHAQLHRTAAAVQQVLAVAAAAAAAAAATSADVSATDAAAVHAAARGGDGSARVAPVDQGAAAVAPAAALGHHKPRWQAVAELPLQDGANFATGLGKEFGWSTRRMAAQWTGGSGGGARRRPPPVVGNGAAAAQEAVAGACGSAVAARLLLLRAAADVESLLQPVRADLEVWERLTDAEAAAAESALRPQAAGDASDIVQVWLEPAPGLAVLMVQHLLLESALALARRSKKRPTDAAAAEAIARALVWTKRQQTQRGGGGGAATALWWMVSELLPSWVTPSAHASHLWAWLLETAAEAAAAEACRAEGPAVVAGGGPGSSGSSGSSGSGGGSSSSSSALVEAVHQVLRSAACFLALLLRTCSGMVDGGLAWLPPQGGARHAGSRSELWSLDPLTLAAAWPTWLLARAQHRARVTPMQLYRTLLLGQLPDTTPPQLLRRPPAVAAAAAAVQRTPPPPPLSYEHCLAVSDAFARDAATLATWTDVLLQPHRTDLEAVQEYISGLQLLSWQAAWDAARRDGGADGGLLEEEEEEDEEEEEGEEGFEDVFDEDASAPRMLEDICNRAYLASAWLRGQHDQLLSPEVGPLVRALVATVGGEAEAAVAARVAARGLGLEGALDDAAALRPPASAIVTALRLLALLRLPAGVEAPVAHLSADAAKLAVAGVEESARGDGGSCDMLRLQVGADTASAAAMMMLLRCRALAQGKAVRQSRSRFMFQPSLLLPEAQAAAGGGRGADAAAESSSSCQQDGPGPGDAAATCRQPPQLLGLEVCRTFVPLPEAKVSSGKPWPYPWSSIHAHAVHVWDDTTTQRDALSALRRALVDRGLGLCAAFVCGPETVVRALGALAQLRAEMLENGRDVAAFHGHTLMYGEAEEVAAASAAAAAAGSGPARQGQQRQQRQPRQPKDGAAKKENGSADDAAADSNGAVAEDHDDDDAEGEEHLRGPIQRPFLALDKAVNNLPPLPPGAVVLHQRLLTSTAAAAAAAAGGTSSGGDGGAAAAVALEGRKEPQQRAAGPRRAQKLKGPQQLRQATKEAAETAAAGEPGGAAGGGGAAAAAPPGQRPQRVAVVVEAAAAAAAAASGGFEAYQHLLRDVPHLPEVGTALEVEMQAGALMQQLAAQQRRLDGGGRAARQQQQQQQQRGAAERQERVVPADRLVLEMNFVEVAPGRPWELVPPPAERVAEWNRKARAKKADGLLDLWR
ncbi:hypothetical protein HXX76_006388 [Chlamydomonas incerta]|uniref:Uncharacterized protein n=1 Tax=Chlamydomonas incerta TaxID=51695 RepID=A0A835T121_CHLIN|nr:hypothetical protein HXX76_006388 [Chlamydomonas incerta]|eukprot:KAG2436868.1 hypothetical protein HXX76_006388 [Chlamydomonas incerta]